MKPGSMKKAKLIYNPIAGGFPSSVLAERAAHILGRNGWETELEQTQDGAHITYMARDAAQRGLDALFVVGGDGSVNLAVAGLLDSDTALGVLPGGTANVWAQEIGLPGLSLSRWLALEESAKRMATGVVHTVDVGMCNDRPFLLWAGVGLDAFIVHRLEPRSRWEKHFAVVQYAASAAWNASFWHGVNLRVKVDGKEVSGHYLIAVVSNIHLYAGGFATLAPDALLDDGVMDLWLFEGETLGDTVNLAWDLLTGRHVHSEQVRQYSFQELQVASDSEMYVQVDGEPVSQDEHVNVSILPRSLKVIAPENTPHKLFTQPQPSSDGSHN